MTNRLSGISVLFGICFLLSGCSPDQANQIEPKDLFKEFRKAGISAQPLNSDHFPKLRQSVPGYTPLGIYKSGTVEWALFDLPVDYNASITMEYAFNRNLYIVSGKPTPKKILGVLNTLTPKIGYEQLGIFIYPLGLCLVIALFVIFERLFSLRRGLTFPRKVEKALLSGEFPSKNWKLGSAAERIVHVSINEKASEETLRTYAKLEVSAMERGMFLLEVVVAGAPLIGLLGTVTGLVEVFSQIPAGNTADKSLFTKGISLALLTTMVGLTIALPTLLANAYLQRVIDKRSAALEWLTARLLEATDRKRKPPEIIR